MSQLSYKQYCSATFMDIVTFNVGDYMYHDSVTLSDILSNGKSLSASCVKICYAQKNSKS